MFGSKSPLFDWGRRAHDAGNAELVGDLCIDRGRDSRRGRMFRIVGIGRRSRAGAGRTRTERDPGAGSGPTATPGSTLFAVTYGGTGVETMSGLASDAAGNFYVGGCEDGPSPPA